MLPVYWNKLRRRPKKLLRTFPILKKIKLNTMCNCGNKRETFASGQAVSLSQPNSIAKQTSKMWPDVKFEYTGKTALSVRGYISGKNYRFARPGDVQEVDYRDASAFMGVGVLKRHR